MRETRGMGRNVIFQGMLPKFQGMSSNISANVLKHSRECRQIFRGMSPNILENVVKHSGECRQTSRGMSSDIPGDVTKHSRECPSAELLL